jgi:hypothetical protein
MSTLSLRLPDSLHRKAKELAEKEGVSINQFVTLAVAEKLSALMTEDYLLERAKRGSRSRYDAALAQVPDVEPPEYARIQPPLATGRLRSAQSFTIHEQGEIYQVEEGNSAADAEIEA